MKTPYTLSTFTKAVNEQGNKTAVTFVDYTEKVVEFYFNIGLTPKQALGEITVGILSKTSEDELRNRLLKTIRYRTFESFKRALEYATNTGFDHEYLIDFKGDEKLAIFSIRCPYGKRAREIIGAWDGKVGRIFFTFYSV